MTNLVNITIIIIAIPAEKWLLRKLYKGKKTLRFIHPKIPHPNHIESEIL
jgi:hypothetical protein